MLLKQIIIVTVGLMFFGCSSDSKSGSSVLEGTWLKSCTVSSTFAIELDFSGSTYTQRLSLPSSGNCNSLDSVLQIVSSFSVGTESDQGNGVTGHQVDFSSLASFSTLSGAAYFNSISLCGKTNWVNNQAVTNLGSSCTSYLIFELVGINSNTLYLGNPSTGNGTSAVTRPTSLDLINPYSRTSK